MGEMADLDQPFGSPDANLDQTITLEASLKSYKNQSYDPAWLCPFRCPSCE